MFDADHSPRPIPQPRADVFAEPAMAQVSSSPNPSACSMSDRLAQREQQTDNRRGAGIFA